MKYQAEYTKKKIRSKIKYKGMFNQAREYKMTAAMIYFDTLQYVKTLESSGIPPKQAEAMAKAQQEALSECLDTTLATKQDIHSLREEISELKSELMGEINPMKADIATLKSDVKWIQWALGFVGAGVGALIFKAFF